MGDGDMPCRLPLLPAPHLPLALPVPRELRERSGGPWETNGEGNNTDRSGALIPSSATVGPPRGQRFWHPFSIYF